MAFDKQVVPGRYLWLFICWTLWLLTGCTSYQAKPLPDESNLVTSLAGLRYKIDHEATEAGSKYEVNPGDGLDLVEVAMIAVLHNPHLRAERARLQVAGAQLFAAGLLPDPQVSANLDIPSGDTAGTVNAWGLGLGYDLLPLLTRQAQIRAAKNNQEKVRLELLWQEWQVMQQACSLAVRYVLELRKLELLQQTKALYLQRYKNSTEAVKSGDISLGVNGTDLTALLDSYSQLNQLEQSHNETHHRLNLLLGLTAGVDLPLKLPRSPVLFPLEVINKELPGLLKQRPDLLALRAGYQSQEAKVRAAVIAQFPSMSIGFTRARDTGDLYTNGFGVSLNLPIFSGNKGPVSLARASREQLRLEYAARLDQAEMDVERLMRLQIILTSQQRRLQEYLPRLSEIVAKTRKAYNNNDIDALTFFNLEYTWVLKRLEELDLEQSQWENSLALQAMVALPEDNKSFAGGYILQSIMSEKGKQ